MKILKESAESLAQAIQILREGGVIVIPTETCYGFACDMSNQQAVQKLFAIKKRPLEQPVSGQFESIDLAMSFTDWNDEAKKLADEYLPGPLTIILPTRQGAPRKLFTTPLTPADSIGVRISSFPIANKIVSDFGSPLVTTSANIHGEANPYSAEEIFARFSNEQEKPDLILDSGVLPRNPPSTVMDLTSEDKRIIRL